MIGGGGVKQENTCVYKDMTFKKSYSDITHNHI